MDNGHAGEGNGVVQAAPEDSMEYNILMTYAKRRRPFDECLHHQDSDAHEKSPKEEPTIPKRRKRKFRLKLPSCIRPKTKDTDSFWNDEDGPMPACMAYPVPSSIQGLLVNWTLIVVPCLGCDLQWVK